MEAISELLSWPRLGLTLVVYFVTLAFYRLSILCLASQVPNWQPSRASTKPTMMSCKMDNITSKLQNCTKNMVGIGVLPSLFLPLRSSPPDSLLFCYRYVHPIVRISPHELRISDSVFFDQLYRQDGVWDKYDWSVDAFASQGAMLLTPKHEVHKARRQPLNPFFSKARVSGHQDMIDQHLDKLCDRISVFAESCETFNFGAAITAFVRDVAFDFILGKSYKSLDHDDFDEVMVAASSGSGQV